VHKDDAASQVPDILGGVGGLDTPLPRLLARPGSVGCHIRKELRHRAVAVLGADPGPRRALAVSRRRSIVIRVVLGLVGLGGIGAAVAERALPFGMRVVARRRRDVPSPVPGVEQVRSLEHLLGMADHLVLTAPSTPETHHLLDAAAFEGVKPGVHIVNIARGALIDQDALRVALDDRRVSIASLDAVDPEPLPEGHWMYSHPQVHLSPHISWSMPGASDLLVETFVENLRRYRAGEPLEGVVDVDAGY